MEEPASSPVGARKARGSRLTVARSALGNELRKLERDFGFHGSFSLPIGHFGGYSKQMKGIGWIHWRS